jgi:dienelactone hydrolase
MPADLATPRSAPVDRRTLLRGVLGTSTAAAVTWPLWGCGDLLHAVAESCPDDPSDSGGVDWPPDVLHPVFYGHQDVTTADGAPTDLRVYFPSVGGNPAGAAILKLCVVRWPVVLFLHGQPPRGADGDTYHQAWGDLVHTLARSGYVVVVPNRSAGPPVDVDPLVAEAQALLGWVRRDWQDAEWVDQQPESTAIAGHSFGALAATVLALEQPQFRALLSFSGTFLEGRDRHLAFDALSAIDTPSLFMWSDRFTDDLDTPVDGDTSAWDLIRAPKHGVRYEGEHFDYLDRTVPHGAQQGGCEVIGLTAGALASLFLGANVRVPLSTTRIPVDLRPPEVELRDRQHFFRGLHLRGLDAVQELDSCTLSLRWEVNGQSGQRLLG